MAMRVARGLLRLWLVLSVLWIGGVSVVTWRTFPAEDPQRAALPSICDLPANQRSEDWDCSWLGRIKSDMDPKQRAASSDGHPSGAYTSSLRVGARIGVDLGDQGLSMTGQDPKSTRQAAIEASIGSVQRIATRIIDLPKDQREAGVKIVRKNYLEWLKENGFDNEQGRACVDLQIEGIKALIAEIEKSGGGHGGTA